MTVVETSCGFSCSSSFVEVLFTENIYLIRYITNCDAYTRICGTYLSMMLSICLEVLLSEEENRDLHRRCVEQYDHLRDEFERYKLRAQSVLKNKSSSTPKVYLDLTIVWHRSTDILWCK